MKVLNSESISHYRTAITVALIVIAIPAIFFDTTAQMMHVWNVNETFTHGYLIFPISLWLIWTKRATLARFTTESELKPMLLLAIVLIAWFLGRIVDVQVVQQIAIVGMIPIAVWTILGRQVLLAILFPMCYLIFAVPIGQSLIPPMMEFTADFTIAMIRFTGIPVFREGLYFTLPSGNWSVVEECSGVRYLIASLALGTIFAYQSYRSMRKRMLFLAAAILVPILANGLRAYGIVMIGHFSGMQLATGVDHLVYGWVFFGIFIFGMFYVGSFWADPVNKSDGASDAAPPVASVLPNQKQLLLASALVIAAIFSVKSLVFLSASTHITTPEDTVLQLPENFEAWQYMADVNIGWRPEFQSPDLVGNQAYRFGNEIVQLDVAYYSHQRQGAEAVSTQNRVTNPISGRWKLTRRVDLQIREQFVTESEIRYGDGKILVWHWYRVGERQTPNAYIAKLFEAYNRIFSGQQDAAMITIATRLGNLEEGRARLEGFLKNASSQINSQIDGL